MPKKLNHKLKTIRIYDIKYDVDYEGQEEELNLPKELTLDVNSDDIEDIDYLASDYISDTTGYCHHGFMLTYA